MNILSLFLGLPWICGIRSKPARPEINDPIGINAIENF